MYDLIIAGGGTAGCATAISAAKKGLSVLVIEKNSFLGGSMTGALVMPMMKNSLKNGTNLSGNLCQEILSELKKTNDSITFSDGNNGWFNSEILKCVLDDLFEKYNIKVIFESIISGVQIQEKNIVSCEIINCSQKITFESKYFVDATGNGDLANICGAKWENGNNGLNQAMSLRFIATNVNIDRFSSFLRSIDKNEEVSPISKINNEIHLSTACTWDGFDWKLKPLFEKAVREGILTLEDSSYFQIFTIPNQPTSIAFNAPRIHSEKPLNPLNYEDISFALIQGRKSIRRLMKFCNIYLPGFENAYISQIAPMLGIRDSRRIVCENILTEEDILSAKKFDNPAAKSNYPIDVHSYKKNESILNKLNENDYYEIPIDCLKVKGFNNLFCVGKIINSTFLAQASLRIIPNCISMGESLGEYIYNLTLSR